MECDVTAIGRFFDLLRRVDDEWRIHRRVAAFEKDSIRPVDPGANIAIDPELLTRFPAGYRYIAYAMSARGVQVSDALPGSSIASAEALAASGAAWLAA